MLRVKEQRVKGVVGQWLGSPLVPNWLFGVCRSWVMVSLTRESLKCLEVLEAPYAFPGGSSSLYQMRVCGLLAFLPSDYRTT